MSEANKTRPSHRVSFARIIGQSEDGSDKLGSAREIGAIWPRKGDANSSILRLDHIPIELTQHQGVIFISSVDANNQEAGQ